MNTGEKRISIGIAVIFVMTISAIVIHGWTDFSTHFATYVALYLSVLATALNRRALPICIAWGVVTLIGMPIFGSLAEAVAEGARLGGFLVWGVTMCSFSYFTGSPQRKCPACAEKIAAEAIRCRHCGELLNSIKA